MNYRNLSSWREQTVHLKAGLNTVDFIDSKPNMFIIQNTTAYPLKVGIGKMPSENNYEFLIAKNSLMPIGRPLPVNQLYIWHDANVEQDISIYSISDDFDISILNNAIMNMECTVETDGIIKGFGNGVSLPAGVNNIGRMTLENLDINAKTFFQTLFNALQTAVVQKMPTFATVPAEKNGTYTITDTSGVTLYNDGNVIFDQIEIITNNSEKDITADIYFTDTDFVPVNIIAHDFFSGLSMPCVRIVFKVNADTVDSEEVTIFGYVKEA